MNFPAIRSSTLWALWALALGVCALTEVQAQTPPRPGHSLPSLSRVERVRLQPTPDPDQAPRGQPAQQPQPTDPISISSQFIWRWKDSGQDIFYARGKCRVTQGPTVLEADEMVFWGGAVESSEEGRLTIYLSGDARLSEPDRTVSKSSMLVELHTRSTIHFDKTPVEQSMANLGIYKRGDADRRRSRQELMQTQYSEVAPDGSLAPWDNGSLLLGQTTTPVMMPRKVTINPRYLGMDLKFHSDVDRNKEPPETMTTVQGGVTIVVENVPLMIDGQMVLSRIDLSADRAVIWTSADGLGNPGGGFEMNENTPFQVYLEGDIVVRQGNSEIEASHAFYDIRDRRGLLMNSELRTYIPEFDSFLRVRADTIRQMSETSFQAQHAWVTTSQLGQPGYRLQAGFLTIDDRPSTWGSRVDPNTGQPLTRQYLTATNSTLFVENIPVFYLPRVSGPIEDTTFPLKSATVGFSGMYGPHVNTVWNIDKLFGFDLPRGTDWDLLLDEYSTRGPAIGTRGRYEVFGQILGQPAHITGMGLAYYIHDTGKDRLGYLRNNLPFPDANRGRVLHRNRIDLPFGVSLTNELSYFLNNDRNFLQQYYEQEFNTSKDQENLANLAVQNDNVTGSLLFQTRLNNIFDQTEWLPRLDLTVLGQPLLNDAVTWSSHSWMGYGHIRPAQAPTDPNDAFTALPYLPDVQGLVTGTRHEVSAPFQLGAVKVAPYALGEAAFWQQDMTANNLSRLYGSAGVRASVEFWRAVPEIQSSILGLNGLAHKVVVDADYSISGSTQSLANIPQYNAFDEDAQERFRERFLSLEFGGTLPAQFDPRFYAVRAGAGQSVTAAYQELVANQQVLRLGLRQRLQTKRGPVEHQRIKDWMSLDLETSIFPNASRDNFGSTLGLLTARYMWQVGERTQFLANGVMDPFTNGQRVWNAGILSQRGPRGSVYVGVREIKAGPIDSGLLYASFTYRMSEKWTTTMGTAYDIVEGRDRGQSMTLTRIGEYLLFHVGTGYDHSRNNFTVNFMLEPRLGGGSRNNVMQMSSLVGGLR